MPLPSALWQLAQQVLDWATPAAQPLPPALPTSPASKPQRHIVLHGRSVGYTLHRRKRRTVGMRITAHGLDVAAPQWVSTQEIERILTSKAPWILRKLHEHHLRHTADAQAAAAPWGDGTVLTYQGQPLVLRTATAPATDTQAPAPHAASAPTQQLSPPRPHTPHPRAPRHIQCIAEGICLLPSSNQGKPAILLIPEGWANTTSTPNANPAATAAAAQHTLRYAVRWWLMQQAHRLFAARMAHYEPLLGVSHTQLALTNARTRWGSASSNGRIRLHWRLIQLAPELLDYVIVHELSHLREMNHSPRFWAIVATACPNYATLRQRLKATHLPPWDKG